VAQHPHLPPIPALLLAAGRGERMRPLTDTCPKPLLQVRGKPLLQWHLEALARMGCTSALINTAWLGEQMEARFGAAFEAAGQAPIALRYSHEGRDFGGALETAGGIARALPLLCAASQAPSDCIFWVAAGDVYAPDFVFDPAAIDVFAASGLLAHLWLVPNPAHHPQGDFGVSHPFATGAGATPLALNLPAHNTQPRYTYSTIGLYRGALFAPPWCDMAPGNPGGAKAPLGPLLRAAMDAGLVSAALYTGRWTDVGTPERLQQMNSDPRQSP